ncbi:MAG: four helix bundle protein [Candidatus Uhrbacteria bacterium]|nr:four helix bundle protein [Candidatus Uhrbacteria bacterium]
MSEKIQSFKDLKAWQEARRLAVRIYQITKKFPPEEIYGMTSQMRRCAISIASNIAEGFSRRHVKEKIRFFTTAAGSLTELYNQLILSYDIGYILEGLYTELEAQIIVEHRILNGLITATRKWK